MTSFSSNVTMDTVSVNSNTTLESFTTQPTTEAVSSTFSGILDELNMSSTTVSYDSNVTSSSFVKTFAYVLDLYLPPLIILVGSICNVLVIIVMRMKYFRQVSTSFYICLNAFVDNVSILIPFPAHWLYVNYPDVLRDTGRAADLMCKVFHFTGYFTSNLGIALTAAMTMERALAIKFPLRALHMCTVEKAKYVSLTLVVFLSIMEVHYLIQSTFVPPTITAFMCEIRLETDFLKVYVKIWPLIQQVFVVIAFILLIGSNVIIIRNVNNTLLVSQPSMKGGPQELGMQRRSARTRQLTVMLLSDSLSIIICTLPLSLLGVIPTQFDDPYASHLVYAIAFYLVYLNRCVNFFLYCLSGERFRQALKSLLPGGRKQESRRSFTVVSATRSQEIADERTMTTDTYRHN